MNNMAIGVFDSGVGGLSCVKELLHCLPCEDINYLGDTLRMPYGIKSVEDIKKFANNNVSFLQRRNVKLIAAACGTVSSNVNLEDLTLLSCPFVDVINPTVYATLAKSQTKRIGIIATPATINAKSLEARIINADPSVNIIAVGCPDFVPLIENGHIDDDLIINSAKGYLKAIKDFDVDTLVLGCTHYPIIAPVIARIMGEGVHLINSGRETALEIKRVLEELDIKNSKPVGGTVQYFVTAKPESFDNVAKIFLNGTATASSQLVNIKD